MDQCALFSIKTLKTRMRLSVDLQILLLSKVMGREGSSILASYSEHSWFEPLSGHWPFLLNSLWYSSVHPSKYQHTTAGCHTIRRPTDTGQHNRRITEDYIHTPSAIRTHDPSVPTIQDALDRTAPMFDVSDINCANCETGGYLGIFAIGYLL
jgi:hypothetical protein